MKKKKFANRERSFFLQEPTIFIISRRHERAKVSFLMKFHVFETVIRAMYGCSKKEKKKLSERFRTRLLSRKSFRKYESFSFVRQWRCMRRRKFTRVGEVNTIHVILEEETGYSTDKIKYSYELFYPNRVEKKLTQFRLRIYQYTRYLISRPQYGIHR